LADIFEEVFGLLRGEGFGGRGYHEVLVGGFTAETKRKRKAKIRLGAKWHCGISGAHGKMS
jgi:hypothetical protein